MPGKLSRHSTFCENFLIKSRILEPLQIPIKVDLPGVGENLQDQPNSNLIYSLPTTFNGSLGYLTFGTISDFLGAMPAANLSQWATKISTATNSSIAQTSIEHLLQTQYDLLAGGAPDAESFIASLVQFGAGPSPVVADAFWLLMPFSRGNIHITSSDPAVYPAINPNFFLVDYDLDVQVGIAKWLRKFWASIVDAVEVSPGFDLVPANASDAMWGDYIKSTCEYHFLLIRASFRVSST